MTILIHLGMLRDIIFNGLSSLEFEEATEVKGIIFSCQGSILWGREGDLRGVVHPSAHIETFSLNTSSSKLVTFSYFYCISIPTNPRNAPKKLQNLNKIEDIRYLVLQMSEAKIPAWLRIANMLFGIITIIVAMLVIALPGLTITILVILIAVGLILLGLARFLRGLFEEGLSSFLRFLNVIAGLLILVLALATVFLQALVVLLLIWILAAAILILGLVRLLVGIMDKELPTWLRTLLIIVGLISLALSFLIFLVPTLGELTLVILLAWALALNGVSRIINAIAGVK